MSTKVDNTTGKICLGTAQFGQDYGIANSLGKATKPQVADILNYAQSVGIFCLDTAWAYGDSESVIGECLRDKPGIFKIVSKLPSLGQYVPGKIAEFFQQSLQRLGVHRLYGYLVHRFKDIVANEDIWKDLAMLKEEGKIEKVGVSLYSPDELVFLLDKEIKLDMVQIPYSIFDRRFEKYFEPLAKKGIAVHARSVFLQGVAFLNLDSLPVFLQEARPALANLQRIAHGEKIPAEALCLNFVLSNPAIDKVVIGVDSLAHLKNNVAAMNLLNKVRQIYSQLNSIEIEREEILLPYQWALKV